MRRKLTLGAALLALIAVPSAWAATRRPSSRGFPLRAGVRNPAHGHRAYRHETSILGKVSNGYLTLESNRSASGGAGLFGCHARAGAKPCLTVNNVGVGIAFDHQVTAAAPTAGVIQFGSNLAQPVSRPPFLTNGTATVPNLNADKVDGRDAPLTLSVSSAGTATANPSGLTVQRTSSGQYSILIPPADISVLGCTPQATIAGGDPALVSAQYTAGPGTPPAIVVHTFDPDGTAADHPYYLTMQC